MKVVTVTKFRAAMACLGGFLLGVGWAQGGVASEDSQGSLAGTWAVRLDLGDEGLAARWFARPLDEADRLVLPGTTDQAGLGAPLDLETLRYPVEFPYTRFPATKATERADERGFLARRHFFLGAAWYEREITIPEGWRDRWVSLRLERVIWRTDVWIDGRPAGTEDSLATPHRHDLGRLAPGAHRLTLRVDNRMQVNLSTITHAYGPETQSRWNGVVGGIELIAEPRVALRRLEVFPAPDRRSVRVRTHLRLADGEPGEGRLRVRAQDARGGVLAEIDVQVRVEAGATPEDVVLAWTRPARAWDEFDPVRYRVQAAWIDSDGPPSKLETWFGFRHIARRGRAIEVNGRRVFLRGTLDCAVYPQTGHPPMVLAEWKRILGIVKSYGFNHVRFHTWCPPEAAFEAADQLGLYLMPETAAWLDDWTLKTDEALRGMGKDPAVNEFLRAEIRRISEAYGNHPSFALFGIGNEFGLEGTDWDEVTRWVEEAKTMDPRRLYTGAMARRNLGPDDFWVTHVAQGKATRGIGSARTDWDFGAAAAATAVPILGHETGQRPVFPDYAALLPKFTGPLLPVNYAAYRDRLEASGLAGQAGAFRRASGRFQQVQYKAEHEAMRRTADYAGYQLLMLNDFTGQSGALVGVLDPFWDSKGVVGPGAVREWNSATVPLARFDRYAWSSIAPFRAELEVSHFGRDDWPGAWASWELVADGGRVMGEGRLGPLNLPAGALTRVGKVEVSLADLDRPTALDLRVRVGPARNHWRLWAYPEAPDTEPGEVRLATQWEDSVETTLAAGGRVVLLAHGWRGPNAKRTGFASVYWSAGWWGDAFSALGILCDPRHPALAAFPNDGHSDWQWRELTEGATTFLLDGAPDGIHPIVQAVPDFHYASRLAQVFEARVGGGRLLVCGYDLSTDLERRPAARQFRRSLLAYAKSEKFRPRGDLSVARLRRWLEATP